MDADLDTLATAPYVRTDELLKVAPEWVPWRPRSGSSRRSPMQRELITLAVLQAFAGRHRRSALVALHRSHLRHLFGHMAKQPGYNKRDAA